MAALDHGRDSISLLGLKIWNLLPKKLNNTGSLQAFKNKIKRWKPENFPCKFCNFHLNISVSFEKRRKFRLSQYTPEAVTRGVL